MVQVMKEESLIRENAAIRFRAFDNVELYVGNAKHAAHYYRTAFGFKPVAYCGPETGVPDRVSYLLEQRNVRLVLTSATKSDSSIAQHVYTHGDGVKDVSFTVDDAEKAFELTVKNGAQPVMEPATFEDEQGKLTKASIAAFGATIHSFIERKGCRDSFLPDYRPIIEPLSAKSTGILSIDHIAIAVEQGTLERWVNYYDEVLGFRQTREEDISTEYSAMNSKVAETESSSIKTVIVEPAPGKRKSPIDEYLTYNEGAGVHHVAFLSKDIIKTIGTLRKNGVEFTTTPHSYYDGLQQRIGPIPEDLSALRQLCILADRDEWGYLMQIFSKPVHTRPTFFFEVIQRKGARGFGSGNIKALFEAIEREQMARGNA